MKAARNTNDRSAARWLVVLPKRPNKLERPNDVPLERPNGLDRLEVP